MCKALFSAGPSESEARRQGGVLSLENNVHSVGGGCEWSNVGLLDKRKRKEC